MTPRFDGRRVVVSGGASGIGAAAVRRFIELGARVIVVDQVPEDHRGLAELLAQRELDDYVRADLASPMDIERATRRISERWPGVDVLYNHAGTVVVKPFLETSYEDWTQLLKVNLLSMVEMTRRLLPLMLTSETPAIVNMASLSARLASPMESAYCVTKAGVVQFTKAVAVEFRDQGLRCNCVSPAMVDTPHGRREIDALTAHGVQLGVDEIRAGQVRLARSEEVAEAVVFLASDAASFVSGAELVIDNAWSAGAG